MSVTVKTHNLGGRPRKTTPMQDNVILYNFTYSFFKFLNYTVF